MYALEHDEVGLENQYFQFSEQRKRTDFTNSAMQSNNFGSGNSKPDAFRTPLNVLGNLEQHL